MRYGFVIDQNRCIGCHACTVACKEEHDVPVGVFRTWVKYIEKGEFPNTSRHFGVMRCNHCEAAPCIEICPTRALYKRSDGIVDFDNSRCIGCKSCMQACPYDALYIDPRSNTAAKCNFCAHRVEQNLEPACVIVCPTRAIIAGDLDEPASSVSRIVATQKVSARKPHKGTHPKLFYVGIDGDLIEPGAVSRPESYFWSEKRAVPGASAPLAADSGSVAPPRAREVYDVAHPAPWGWKIAAYLWTKSIAAGVLIVAAFLGALGFGADKPLFAIASPAVALVFLGITAFLLVIDLKRPDRFHYLLFKGNPSSWLVIGGYILTACGGLAALWLGSGLFLGRPRLALTAATGIVAIGCACYTAFLFAQAKARDLWQSPLFFWHLLVQALAAGAAAIILLGAAFGADRKLQLTAGALLAASLAVGLGMILAEVALPHVSEDVKRAIRMLTAGALSVRFWTGAVVLGGLVPIILVLFSAGGVALNILAAILALAGLWVFEDLWVKAGQSVPLS